MAGRAVNVLIVAAHGDDEVLGVGGTIAWHIARGDAVRVVIAADCRTVRGTVPAPALPDATRAATRALGVGSDRVHFLGHAGMTLALRELDLNRQVTQHVLTARPEIVYSHHAGDPNSDHRAVAHAAMIACRPVGGASPARLLAFETPSSTDQDTRACFLPNVFVALDDPHVQAKQRAIECYADEARDAPHPRNAEMLRARAIYWGQHANVAYAEPFVLLREVLR